MNFHGQHVVVTGASTGIGRATAEKIAGPGPRPLHHELARVGVLLPIQLRDLPDAGG